MAWPRVTDVGKGSCQLDQGDGEGPSSKVSDLIRPNPTQPNLTTRNACPIRFFPPFKDMSVEGRHSNATCDAPAHKQDPW